MLTPEQRRQSVLRNADFWQPVGNCLVAEDRDLELLSVLTQAVERDTCFPFRINGVKLDFGNPRDARANIGKMNRLSAEFGEGIEKLGKEIIQQILI